MFVLTLGVVPTHCVDDYEVKVGEEIAGDAKVTVMAGWVPLFMSALPKWKYGSDPNLPAELIEAAESAN